MHHVALPDGKSLPALGLGTWRMGEARGRRPAEVAALRNAIELGYRLFDTAELYGEGGAEEVVGQAVAEAVRAGDVRRDDLFIVSKVVPHNASRAGTLAACERSRRRLRLDTIDLYLLHWRGAHPLRDTVDSLRALAGDGRIGRWGVSNFDVDDMTQLVAAMAPPNGASDDRLNDDRVADDRVADGCATNQVYYSLSQRGVEFDLLPWLRARRLPLMAYSPIDQGAMAGDRRLAAIGAPRGLTAVQVALAWLLAQPGVVAIPKAGQPQHLRDNLAAASVELTAAECEQVERAFPAPTRAQPLAML